MTDLRIEIDPAVLERFPDCRVGGFLARGLRSAAGRLKLEGAETLAAPLTVRGVTVESISDEPRIREWRKTLDAAFSELARDLRDAGAGVGETTYVNASEPAAAVRLVSQ